MKNDIECSNCHKWQEVKHDDGAGYAEETIHEQECKFCLEPIRFVTTITFNYEVILQDKGIYTE